MRSGGSQKRSNPRDWGVRGVGSGVTLEARSQRVRELGGSGEARNLGVGSIMSQEPRD